MQISHPWDPDPLFLGDGNEFEDRCSICKKEFDGNPFYACVDCKYYVHKSCAQLPVQIQHHFHPPHRLRLCFGDEFACDSCHKIFRNELRFGCSDCKFNLDVKCALMSDIDTEGKEFITHFTHQHPLTICSKDGDKPLKCFACKKTSSDLIYGCTPCDYCLHKSCARISTHVMHARHGRHALSLVVNSGFCRICGHSDYKWKLYCSICNLLLDASCLIESVKDDKNSKRSCFFCGKQHLDSDSCVDSLYLINQSCIQLPEEIKREFHSHKLLLLVGTEDFTCDSCHKWFVTQSHYGCEECNFRMDVVCALMPSIQYEESDESFWSVIPHHFKHQHPLQLISEIINVFKKNPEKDELKIAGDFRLGYAINPSRQYFTGNLLLDLLRRLDATDMWWLSLYFPNGKLFLREEDPRGTLEQNSSFDVEDDNIDIIEELFFYNDNIFWNIQERLKVFKPFTKYHIQPDECELPLMEVEGYNVTFNFADHFRILFMKYDDFGHNSTLSKNAKSVLLYFLCRVLQNMCGTLVVDVTEKQLFTWLYYIKGIRDGGFDLEFMNPYLDRIKRSYFGLRAIKFENEAPGRLNRKIVNLEQKIYDTKTQIEELKMHRQLHRVGKLAEESKVMREFFTEAKELKWQIAGKGIF